ncbi:MAG: DUF4232 domain-containing protein [Chloroflexota bacterium]|nr:DUF4232 domain-containing protein [Chloroflexota bacterium]
MNDHDRLERSLRTPGPRERGYRHEPLPLSLADARRQRGAARPALRWALIGAVAASAAVVTLAVTLGLPREPVGSSAGNSSAASSSVEGTSSATPAPTSNPAAPCLASNLAISADPWGGAAGSRGTSPLFRTVDSAGPCTLQGSPEAEVVDAAGKVLVSSAASNAGSPVQLGAGHVAELIIVWHNWCPNTEQPMAVTLVLHLQGASIELKATDVEGGSTITAPPCNGAGQPSTLSVVPFQASTRQFPPG